MNNDILWKIDSEIGKDKRVVELTKKCEILEENNKLLIQQKYQMYEDLDMLSKRIDKAIEYIKNNCLYYENYDYNAEDELELKYVYDDKATADLLQILGDKE